MFGVKQVVAVALWGGLAVCSAGCGGDRSGEAATTSTPPTPVVETPPSTLDPETEVEQAYLAFEDMFRRLRENPDPDDPEIAQRTTGETREAFVKAQTTMKTLGERATFGDKQALSVLSIEVTDVDLAEVHSCAIEDKTVTNSNGAQQHELMTYWTRYTLQRVDGMWLVSSSSAVDRREGVQACDA